jgi:hypothetical protein
MMRTIARVTTAFAVAALTACDHAPTSPSPPSTAVGLTIAGPGAIRTGFPTTYTSTATLDNGRTETAQPAWTSSDPGVAAVDAGGSVIGLAHGSITLTAAYRGATTSKTVDVVNDYGGEWSGTSVIRQCAWSGDLEAGLRSYVWYWPTCDWLRAGKIIEATLRLSHDGADLRQVSGELDYTPLLVQFVGHYDVFGFVPLTGRISDEGRLILAGALTNEGVGSAVDRWETTLTTPGEMRGRWFQDFTTARPAIRVYWEAEVLNWTKAGR